MDDVHPSRTYKVLPVPQAPMLHRETASIQPEKIDTRSARNLLCKVFKKPYAQPPAAKKLQANHVQFLLETPIGRDFNLITAAGVEFKVHSIMLIGGPKALQEGLFPGGVSFPFFTFALIDANTARQQFQTRQSSSICRLTSILSSWTESSISSTHRTT